MTLLLDANLKSHYSEAVAQRCSVKKVFQEISQNSQENTCARVSFLIKLQARPATLLKKRLWYKCFPVNFAKFLKTPFPIEHLWQLLLFIDGTIPLHNFKFRNIRISFHCKQKTFSPKVFRVVSFFTKRVSCVKNGT